MKIKQGTTRFVIIHKNYAIKIGKIRPIRHLGRVLAAMFLCKYKKSFKKYGEKYLEIFKNDFMAGLYCNRREFEYFQQTNDCRVAPTIDIKLCGWIIIQHKAEELDNDYFKSNLDQSIPKKYEDQDCETTDSKQFGLFSGRVVLVDYGRISTIKGLHQSLPTR